MKKIILIDNYDSFTFNLYHFLSSLKVNVDVVRNDQITQKDIIKKKYNKIVISPGPGNPNQSGNCLKIVKSLYKKIPILDDIRDESDESIRLILVPRNRDVDPEQLMEALFSLSDLETRFSVNLNALSNNIPIVHGLRDLLLSWLDHRKEVLLNISNCRLNKIEERLEVLSGLLIAYLNMDEIIKIIREEDDPKDEFIKRFELLLII